jgi:hypothetical protein
MRILTRDSPHVYLLSSDLKARLAPLIVYALHHPHSAQWLGAISAIIAREGRRHG